MMEVPLNFYSLVVTQTHLLIIFSSSSSCLVLDLYKLFLLNLFGSFEIGKLPYSQKKRS